MCIMLAAKRSEQVRAYGKKNSQRNKSFLARFCIHFMIGKNGTSDRNIFTNTPTYLHAHTHTYALKSNTYHKRITVFVCFLKRLVYVVLNESVKNARKFQALKLLCRVEKESTNEFQIRIFVFHPVSSHSNEFQLNFLYFIVFSFLFSFIKPDEIFDFEKF